jgi:hypothetical protein
MTFATDNYEIVRQALSKELVEYIKCITTVQEDSCLFTNPPTLENPYPYSCGQVSKSFSWYSAPHTEGLMVYLKPVLERVTQKRLHESYTFYRIYYNEGILRRHTDRPSCEFSATICIEKTHDWPIFFEKLDGTVSEINMNEGDLVVYKGMILPHWREEYKGGRHTQIFIHFVDADGPFKSYRYDRRPVLGITKK